MTARAKELPTCLMKCIQCGQWIVECTQPRTSYVCPDCRARGHELGPQIRQLEREIAQLRAQIAALDAPAVGKPTTANSIDAQGE